MELANTLNQGDIVIFTPISKDIVRSMNDFDHVSEYMLFTGLTKFPVYEDGQIKIVSLDNNYYFIKALLFNAPLTGKIFRALSRYININTDIKQAKELLEKVENYCADRNIKFLLIFLPVPKELKKGRYKIDITGFNSYDIRKEYPKDDEALRRMRFKDDSHWTCFGHEVTASAIISMLKTNKILPKPYFKNSDRKLNISCPE